MTVATVQEQARVQVAVRGEDTAYVVDVPMPSQIPLGDNIAELIPFLRKELDAQGRDSSWLDDPEAYWTLRKPFHTEDLDLEKTLQQSKIFDGTRLLLVKRTPGEKFPPLIDDLAEAIAFWLKQMFRSWDYDISQRVSLTVLPAVVGLLSILLLRYAAVEQPSMTIRAAIAGVCGVTVLLLTTLVVVIVRTSKQRYRQVVVPLLAIIYTLTATSAIVAVPRPYSFYQLMVAASGLLALGILLAVITSTNIRIHYGVTVGALVVILVGAFNLFYSSPPAIVAAQILIIGSAFFMLADRIALSLAGISAPSVPTTGESFVADTDRPGDRDAGDFPGEGAANEEIFNQKQQTLAWYDASIGVIAGSLAVMVVGGWALGYYLIDHRWLLCSYVLVIASILFYRGKSYDDARTQGTILVLAAALTAAFSGGAMFSPNYADKLPQLLMTAGVLLAGAAFGAIWSVQERKVTSPLIEFVFERIERILCLLPWPLLILAMDLFQKARVR